MTFYTFYEIVPQTALVLSHYFHDLHLEKLHHGKIMTAIVQTITQVPNKL